MTENTRGYPWLKMYTNWPENPKLRKLSDAQKWRYIHLYMLAGRSDAGGLLILNDEILDAEYLAYEFRQSVEVIECDLEALQKAGLIEQENGGYIVSSFMDEQGSSHADKREQWRERQQKRRAGLKAEQDKEPEPEEDQELDLDLEKEKEKEQDKDKEVTGVSRVTLSNIDEPSSSDKNIVVVSLFSFLKDNFSKTEVDLFNAADGEMEWELSKTVCQYFIEKIKEYGSRKTIAYLIWSKQNNHTWSQAMNTEKRNNMIKDWVIPEEEKPKPTFKIEWIVDEFDQVTGNYIWSDGRKEPVIPKESYNGSGNYSYITPGGITSFVPKVGKKLRNADDKVSEFTREGWISREPKEREVIDSNFFFDGEWTSIPKEGGIRVVGQGLKLHKGGEIPLSAFEVWQGGADGDYIQATEQQAQEYIVSISEYGKSFRQEPTVLIVDEKVIA